MPQAVTPPRGKNVTIIGGGNAVCFHITPYSIFPGKRWNEELLKGTSPGTKGEISESGWSNASSFMNYLQNNFHDTFQDHKVLNIIQLLILRHWT